MAVTTTYALNTLQSLSLQTPLGSVDDIGQNDYGGFTVLGASTAPAAPGVAFDAYNAVPFALPSGFAMTGSNAAIAHLAGSNLVLVSQDADSIRFKVITNGGGTIVAEHDIGILSCTNADVAALGGGGFVVVDQRKVTATDNDIDVNIFSSTGGLQAGFRIDISSKDDRDATVAALDGTGFAVAWTRTIGAETELWYAVYENDGTVRKAPTLADTTGSINRHASISAMNGGFAIAYEDNGWGAPIHTDISLATYNAAGNSLGTFKIANNTDSETNPALVRLQSGLLGLACTNTAFQLVQTVVRVIDQTNGAVLAGHFLPSTGNNADQAALAGFGDGKIAAFQHDIDAGVATGEALQITRTATGDILGNSMNGDGAIDIFDGGAGNDILIGNNNSDTLDGGSQDDLIDGGQGADTCLGGDGDDTFIVRLADIVAGDVIDGQAGTGDDINFWSTADLSVASIAGIEKISFRFFAANDQPMDATFGGSQLGAGLSAALAVTGRGGFNDKVTVIMGQDTIVTAKGWTFAAWSAAVDADRLTFKGDADNEQINGSSQRDTIMSGAGADTLNGGLENDILHGGGADGVMDRFVFNTALGASNVDLIKGFEAGIDEVRIKDAIFTGLATGNLSAAAFHTGAGAGDGNDHIIYNSANGNLYYDADGTGATAQIRFANIGAGLALNNLDFVVF